MADKALNKNVLFIYNPYSGRGRIKYFLEEIINKLSKAGYRVTIYATQGQKDATEIVRELHLDKSIIYDMIICSGGDGTLDEVVKGILNNNMHTTLGYIPSGTVNDFAHSLGIPMDMVKATDIIINGKEFKCDIGSLNKEYFTYVAAFGVFTSVAYSTDQDLKNVLGKLAYFLEGTKQIVDIPSYKIKLTAGEVEIEDEFILGMVTNSKSVGGMKTIFLDDTELNDGLFEVTLVKRPNTLSELTDTIKSLATHDFSYSDGLVKIFKTSELKIESAEEIAWTLDGENGGKYTEVNIQNHKEAITIKVSKDS